MAYAGAMNEMAARYDRRSRTYARCWAPVLRGPAVSVLRHVAGALDRPGTRLLDVGTGTGTLAIEAARRFPGARVTGLDLSQGMLDQAAEGAGAAGVGDRIGWVEAAAAGAEAILGDGRFDAVVSSFALQLVPDRGAALASIRRLLRPGGILAFVTWSENAKPDPLESGFNAALAAVLAATGLPAPVVATPPRAGPIPDPASARAELAAAGFEAVGAEAPPMEFDFGREGGRDLVVEYDRAAELDLLPPEAREAVIRRFDAALAAAPDRAFVWRPRIVEGWGTRPAERRRLPATPARDR